MTPISQMSKRQRENLATQLIAQRRILEARAARLRKVIKEAQQELDAIGIQEGDIEQSLHWLAS